MNQAILMEQSLLFSAEMVRAILAGKKTQTRRVVRPAPPSEVTSAGRLSTTGEWQWLTGDPRDADTWETRGDWFRCPLGRCGDHLWVRETFAPCDADGRPLPKGYAFDREDFVVYAADFDAEINSRVLRAGAWRPSIHMPRWASRITLKITGIGLERLQETSEEDAKAEGVVSCAIPPDEHGPLRVGYMVGPDDGKAKLSTTPQEPFMELWDSLAKPGAKWADNPWVWVIEFKRVT